MEGPYYHPSGEDINSPYELTFVAPAATLLADPQTPALKTNKLT